MRLCLWRLFFVFTDRVLGRSLCEMSKNVPVDILPLLLRFLHFSSAAFIEKKRRTGTYASINKYYYLSERPSIRIQVKTATGRIGDKQNGDTPKRRQPERRQLRSYRRQIKSKWRNLLAETPTPLVRSATTLVAP